MGDPGPICAICEVGARCCAYYHVLSPVVTQQKARFNSSVSIEIECLCAFGFSKTISGAKNVETERSTCC